MKTRDFQQILSNEGFVASRQTGSHRIWDKGPISISVPQGEINMMLARKLLKKIDYKGQVPELKYKGKQ